MTLAWWELMLAGAVPVSAVLVMAWWAERTR